jgi:hypothetical protein
MKRVLCTLAAIAAITSAAFAGDMNVDKMTPEQAMGAMVNCPVCSVWMTEPALAPTLRHSINMTKNGYVETLSTVDASQMAAFEKCATECDKRAKSIPTMSAEEKAKLCPICIGQTKFMGNKDVTVEHFMTPTGMVAVGSAASPDAVKQLHGYAKMNTEFGEKMAAAMKAPKEPMKSKM